MFRQSKRNSFLFSIDSAAIVAIVLFLAVGSRQASQENADQLAVGIPFEKKAEHYFVSVGRPWWFVTLILPKDHYSQENLEKIFRYYQGKYPDKHKALTVDIFADVESYERFLNDSTKSGTVFSDKPPEPKTRDNWDRAHASFLRACDNEFYYYSPDLENPVQRERVLLKGRWTLGPELSECREQDNHNR